MKRLIILTVVVFGFLTTDAQILKPKFRNVTTDTILGLRDTLFISDGAGATGYMFIRNDSLYFGDGQGEYDLGTLSSGSGGTGDVKKTGTPVDNQIAEWINDSTIQGVNSVTLDTIHGSTNVIQSTSSLRAQYYGGVNDYTYLSLENNDVALSTYNGAANQYGYNFGYSNRLMSLSMTDATYGVDGISIDGDDDWIWFTSGDKFPLRMWGGDSMEIEAARLVVRDDYLGNNLFYVTEDSISALKQLNIHDDIYIRKLDTSTVSGTDTMAVLFVDGIAEYYKSSLQKRGLTDSLMMAFDLLNDMRDGEIRIIRYENDTLRAQYGWSGNIVHRTDQLAHSYEHSVRRDAEYEKRLNELEKRNNKFRLNYLWFIIPCLVCVLVMAWALSIYIEISKRI